MCFLIQVFLMVIYANCNFGNGLHGLIKNETSMDSMLIYRREMYGPAGPPVNGPGDPIKPMAGDDPSMASIIAMDTYIPLRYLFPYWSYGHRVFLITTTARYNRGSVAVGPAAAQDKPGGLLGFNNKLNKRQRTDRMNLNFYDCNLICPKFYEHYGKVCGRRQIHTIKNFTYVIQTFKNLCKLEHANCQSDISMWRIMHRGECSYQFRVEYEPIREDARSIIHMSKTFIATEIPQLGTPAKKTRPFDKLEITTPAGRK